MLSRKREPSIVKVITEQVSPEMIRIASPDLRVMISLPASSIRNLLVKIPPAPPVDETAPVVCPMVLGAGWFVLENCIRKGLEHMVDERCRARIVDAVLKFGVGCVGTLCMVDHPDQEVANIFDVVFFDCHY